jgi:hypothetical protein
MPIRPRRLAIIAVGGAVAGVAIYLLLVVLRGGIAPPAPLATFAIPPADPAAAILVGAGDIASCASDGDEATAVLLQRIPGTVFTLGDNAYESGTATEFAGCYGPSWGVPSIKERTRPVAGNHEYNTEDAAGYYAYFGAAAGDPSEGWYAFDHGAWRVYVLNSNCAEVGGCGDGSPQAAWLAADLEASRRSCVLAMWHHPLFSSGDHGSNRVTEPLFQLLYDAGAELVLVGHDHTYERFAPQDPNGNRDDARGIVEVVVGTGGKSHYGFRTALDTSVVREGRTHGVLRVSLLPGAYELLFVPVDGATFSDSARGACH